LLLARTDVARVEHGRLSRRAGGERAHVRTARRLPRSTQLFATLDRASSVSHARLAHAGLVSARSLRCVRAALA
jgi:hypothetical protein